MGARRRLPASPTDDPPIGLIERAGAIKSDKLVFSGVTTTADGRWAILLQVKKGQVVDREEAKMLAGTFPVVVQRDSGEEQVARPAFPDKGE